MRWPIIPLIWYLFVSWPLRSSRWMAAYVSVHVTDWLLWIDTRKQHMEHGGFVYHLWFLNGCTSRCRSTELWLPTQRKEWCVNCDAFLGSSTTSIYFSMATGRIKLVGIWHVTLGAFLVAFHIDPTHAGVCLWCLAASCFWTVTYDDWKRKKNHVPN